ncbi:RRQRL motif-containing zinc-binding protein [Streptomyces sp. NPDC087272]|uniref:RRQRL motif-containing zinc-binding protein n=1 Tax=Streptomyces sp. NPDC087272 TaxID=3365775 RepID=UPI003816B091
MKYHDPDGEEYGIPTYPRRLAPEGLATRRQLRARGLRPAGQDVAAQILWTGRRDPLTRTRPIRVAYLYRIDLAAPVRPMTPGRWRAIAAMMRARRTCPVCLVTYPYVIPTSLGCCPGCADAPAAAAA